MDPGILKIDETHKEEIEAIAAKVMFTVEGENFVYGNAALEKCLEVRQIVEQVKQIKEGVEINVRSIHIKSETGWFSKSSKGIYGVEAKVSALGRLNDLLGILVTAKNLNVDSIEWVFDEEKAKVDAARKAMLKAKQKADSMMQVISYVVAGIQMCSDSYILPEARVTTRAPSFEGMGPAVSRARVSSGPLDLGTEIKGKREITATVSVEFIIAPAKS